MFTFFNQNSLTPLLFGATALGFLLKTGWGFCFVLGGVLKKEVFFSK